MDCLAPAMLTKTLNITDRWHWTHDITGKKANSLLWGCVPASILCTGTPQQVKDDVKAQVDLMGDTGARCWTRASGFRMKPSRSVSMRFARRLTTTGCSELAPCAGVALSGARVDGVSTRRASRSCSLPAARRCQARRTCPAEHGRARAAPRNAGRSSCRRSEAGPAAEECPKTAPRGLPRGLQPLLKGGTASRRNSARAPLAALRDVDLDAVRGDDRRSA